MIHRPQLELLAGTRNRGKIREIQELLADLPITLRSLDDFPDIPTVDEVGNTYEENSGLKALGYATWTRLPTLADDSGLEVDALGGMPGPLSARDGGDVASDIDRTRKLLLDLDQKQAGPRTARFVCCLTLAGWNLHQGASDGEPLILNVSRGEIEGQIVKEPRGVNGFGYDPVFVPIGYEATLAELPTADKNSISHRARALAAMRTFLERWLRQT
jgi:non-canonical purine NTP pyrophosphatase (RdgB/HAM1 family)